MVCLMSLTSDSPLGDNFTSCLRLLEGSEYLMTRPRPGVFTPLRDGPSWIKPNILEHDAVVSGFLENAIH